MAKLIILTGEESGKTFNFEENEEIIIGRALNCDIVLNDLRASRLHAKIKKINNHYFIEDLNSQNGTYVNGRRIYKDFKLKDNDRLKIGTTWLIFNLDEEILERGRTFYGYKIIKKIKEEKTGEIYLAEQIALFRNVLLWALPFQKFGENKEEIEKTKEIFIEQISKISNLFHKNILMLLDFGATKSYFYCIFENVDLQLTLENYLNNNILSISNILEIAIQTAEGLNYAQLNGISHLNLNPNNILIQLFPYERVILTEFGLSSFLKKATTCVQKKELINNYIYTIDLGNITNEINYINNKNNKSLDIFSYGCFLHHIISGNPPNNIDKEKNYISLKNLNRKFPVELLTITKKCLNCSYNSFKEILRDLYNIKNNIENQNMLNLYLTKNKKRKKYLFFILHLIIIIIISLLIFFSIPILFE